MIEQTWQGFRNYSMEVHVVRTDNGRLTISTPEPDLRLADSTDRVRQAIEWFAARPNRLAAWIGCQIRFLHGYYLKLEDKIDPGERVLKAMATKKRFIVYADVPVEFYRFLRLQRWKHVFWFSIDGVITAVVVVLTPLLAPIPGPNVFFYYPVLRLLSHLRAIRGASSGIRSREVQFRIPPDRLKSTGSLGMTPDGHM